MGAGRSQFEEGFRNLSEGPLERFTDELEIKRSDLKKIYKIFCKIDDDGSGSVGVEEFFDHFDLEYGAFAERAFSIMDVNRSGSSHLKLDFEEFFVGLYNYCTQSHDTLVKFAFDLFDIDGGGEISMDEFKELIKMVYGKKGSETQMKKVLKNMDKSGDGTITLEEFRKQERKNRSLLLPAFQLQQSLVKGIMGARFWDRESSRRAKLKPGEDLIEWFHAAMNDGQKLDRSKINENADELVEGEVKKKTGTPIRDAPTLQASIVRKIELHEKITVYDEEEVTEKVKNEAEGKMDDVTHTWLRIHEEHAWYVRSDHCRLFNNKSAAEKRVAKAKKEAKEKKKKEGKGGDSDSDDEDEVRKKRAEESAAIENKNWIQTTDPKTGRDYWYDTLTFEVTWVKPPGAGRALKAQKK